MDLVGKKVCLVAANNNKKFTLLKMIISADSITQFASSFNAELKKKDVWDLLLSAQGREVAASMFLEKNVRLMGKEHVHYNSLLEAINSQIMTDEFDPNYVLVFDFKTNDTCWVNQGNGTVNNRLNGLK